ncbi:MAG: tRNA (guanine(37)-N(1))-methyltransferase, partial [Myxococcota bacterium]
MKISVITIFPDIFDALNYGVVGQALKDGKFELNRINLRDFTQDPHKTVDDRPFGGGAGMVMLIEPIFKALNKEDPEHKAHRVLLSCSGNVYSQDKAKEFLRKDNILFICGRYEGVDERIGYFIDEEISIGDFVLSGGEIAACAIIDSIVRLMPDVVGNPQSI